MWFPLMLGNFNESPYAKKNGLSGDADIGYFPDAPTERGVKHLRELIRAAGEGYRAIAAFVIQMDGVTEVRPNTAAHPEFAAAFAEAVAAGVQILMLSCHVEPDRLEIRQGFEVK